MYAMRGRRKQSLVEDDGARVSLMLDYKTSVFGFHPDSHERMAAGLSFYCDKDHDQAAWGRKKKSILAYNSWVTLHL